MRLHLTIVALGGLLACQADTVSSPHPAHALAPAAAEPQVAPGADATSEPETPMSPRDCAKTDADDAWTEALLTRALGADSEILADPAAHRLQVLVGEIDRSTSPGCLTWHPYRLGAEYFYPASAIKPIAAVSALSTFRSRLQGSPELAGVGLDTEVRVVGAKPAKLKPGEPPPPPPTVRNLSLIHI